MSAHKELKEHTDGLAAGTFRYPDPGSTGVIRPNVSGVMVGIHSVGTRYLPNPAGLPVGFRLLIFSTAACVIQVEAGSGDISLDVDNNDTATFGATEDYAEFIVVPTNAAETNKRWQIISPADHDGSNGTTTTPVLSS